MAADWITLALNLGGLASLAFGGLAWVRSAAKKEYASERDFEHLKRNYGQMKESLQLLNEETEAIARDVAQSYALLKDVDHNLESFTRMFAEHKAFVLALANRMEGIATKLDSSTNGWMRSGNG